MWEKADGGLCTASKHSRLKSTWVSNRLSGLLNHIWAEA